MIIKNPTMAIYSSMLFHVHNGGYLVILTVVLVCRENNYHNYTSPSMETAKILFVWHQSFLVKSYGKTPQQTHKQTQRVNSLSPSYREW